MDILEIDTHNRQHVQQFLQLPFSIYAGAPQWVPPLEMDARRMLDRRKHPFYGYGQAAFLLALEGGRPVGRLAVMDNARYNQFNHTRAAFFHLFECENNPSAASCLFEWAFDWTRRRGLEQILGPKGLTVFDGSGMLVKGFEHRPAFGVAYNPAYYPALVEGCGFTTHRELLSGYLSANMHFPEKIQRAAELLVRRRGLHIATYRTRRDLRALVPHLKDLYNAALAGYAGNVPLTDADVKGMASQMLWFADPHLVKIVLKGDQPVGFLMAYPDISAALQRTQGKLFPFGWIQLLLELRRTSWININGAGMIDGYRGLGGTALLFSEMFRSVSTSRHYRHADLVMIGAENEAMLREMRDLGIEFYKMHRLYEQRI